MHHRGTGKQGARFRAPRRTNAPKITFADPSECFRQREVLIKAERKALNILPKQRQQLTRPSLSYDRQRAPVSTNVTVARKRSYGLHFRNRVRI